MKDTVDQLHCSKCNMYEYSVDLKSLFMQVGVSVVVVHLGSWLTGLSRGSAQFVPIQYVELMLSSCPCLSYLKDWFDCTVWLPQDARGDQCDKCGKLINATELKVAMTTHY